MNNEVPQIDAVITWVDGSDESHQRKRNRIYHLETGKEQSEIPTGRDSTRFVDNGELKFCIRSIRQHAPWIRNIYLITDDQVPDFLTEEVRNRLRIRIVDHREILEGYEWAIPTFNSRTLETALWRIKGLSDRFIYFNDDFVITQPVKPEDFFRGDKVVLRGKWKKVRQYGSFRLKLNDMLSMAMKKVLGITRTMNLLFQIKSAQLAGFYESYYMSPHVPHPVRKETLVEFFNKKPSLFEENIRYRFRSTEQFSGIYLANHLEIRDGNAILERKDESVMLNGEMDIYPILQAKLSRIKNRQARFVCIQGMETFSRAQRRKIKTLLKDEFDLNAPFPKTGPADEKKKEAVNS
ncbi:stealth family protein [Rhodohalobacter mucosus]|uniref:Stealth-like protein n=1 Tax=Rhodohalobacter mucosus TaxID=2079485 RepID=A0A316TTN1_9BACT|nr:stealth family protein [Rhodohalobacter mucosus]PWN07218.1 hypothetical protein DDZ15_05310 [Rhodohalobacter mucosus]